MLGAALSQVDEYHQIVPSGASPEFNVGTLLDSVASLFTMGMMLGLVYTLVSTMAGISVELLLKNQQSVNVAGVLLYSLGAIFNVMLAIAQVHLLPSAKYDNLDRTNADSVIEVGNDSDETIMGHLIHQQENQTPVEDVQWVDWEAMSHTYLRGWELPATWCIMGLMAINGLMIARVMRRYDNIVKIAYTSISNVILYLYAVYIEESRTLSFTLVISFVVINYASYMYQNNKQLYKTPMLEMRQLEIIASAALEDDVEMGCCLFAHPRDHQMSRTSAEAAIHKDVTRMASVSIG